MQASLPGREVMGTQAGQPQHGRDRWPRERRQAGRQAGVSPWMRLPPRSTESPVLIYSFLFGASCIRCGAHLAAEAQHFEAQPPEHPPLSGAWGGMLGSAPAQEHRAFGCLCRGGTIPSGGHPQGTAAMRCPKAGESCWGPASPSDGLIWGGVGLGVPVGFLLASVDQQRETKARLEPEHHVQPQPGASPGISGRRMLNAGHPSWALVIAGFEVPSLGCPEMRMSV